MSIGALFQPNVTQLSATRLSIFPEPIKPDRSQCQLWFKIPLTPESNDCIHALTNLEIGEDPVPYRPLRLRDLRTQPPNLLLIETLGQHILSKFEGLPEKSIRTSQLTMIDCKVLASSNCEIPGNGQRSMTSSSRLLLMTFETGLVMS